MKRFIIAGHSVQTPGAISYLGTTEHFYTNELQDLVVSLAGQNGGIIRSQGSSMSFVEDSERMGNAQVRDFINSQSKPGDYGIDIHFNNNHPTATGTEVVIHPNTGPENRRRAAYMVNEISKVLKIPLRRRVPSRDWIFPSETFVGRIGIIEQTKIPMILLEVCFLNKRDLTKYLKQKMAVARIIYQAMFVQNFK